MSEKVNLEILERDFLLNSKILFELNRNITNTPNSRQIFHSTDGICIYLIDRNSLYFSTHSTPKFALDIFAQLASIHIKTVEGSQAIINTICSYVDSKNQPFKTTTVSLFSCLANFPDLEIDDSIELIRGVDLLSYGGEYLVSQFIEERLERKANKLQVTNLILSPENEFIGLKRNSEIVCIAAWIESVHLTVSPHCLSKPQS